MTGEGMRVLVRVVVLSFASLAACANADTSTYAITGFSKGSPTSLGTFVRGITGSTEWATPIEVARGTYDELLIDIGMSASWITVAEVMVYDSTSGCVLP